MHPRQGPACRSAHAFVLKQRRRTGTPKLVYLYVPPLSVFCFSRLAIYQNFPFVSLTSDIPCGLAKKRRVRIPSTTLQIHINKENGLFRFSFLFLIALFAATCHPGRCNRSAHMCARRDESDEETIVWPALALQPLQTTKGKRGRKAGDGISRRRRRKLDVAAKLNGLTYRAAEPTFRPTRSLHQPVVR